MVWDEVVVVPGLVDVVSFLRYVVVPVGVEVAAGFDGSAQESSDAGVTRWRGSGCPVPAAPRGGGVE